MGREHARILTSIWQDPDFLALGPEAQRMYMLVLSQDGLTYCGSMTFTPRRWAALSAGTDRDAVEKAIHELEDARFLVVDWEMDELLVRSFLRNDQGLLDQPNMVIAARKAAEAMMSRYLKAALADDLAGHADEVTGRKGWPQIADWVTAHRTPSAKGSANPSPIPSDMVSAKGVEGLTPPPAPAPTPTPATNTDGADSASPPPPAEPDIGHDDFWNAYPRHALNQKPGGGGSKKRSESAWKRLTKTEREAAMTAVAHYAEWCSRPEGEYPAHSSTWLNDRRWEAWTEPAPPTARGRPAHAASDATDAERHDPSIWR